MSDQRVGVACFRMGEDALLWLLWAATFDCLDVWGRTSCYADIA
jgi:hypothetical protein